VATATGQREDRTTILVVGGGLGGVAAAPAATGRGADATLLAELQGELRRAGVELRWPEVRAY
jgi:cation diffusion facilitator CzcD-associated flavoprotein CzcO